MYRMFLFGKQVCIIFFEDIVHNDILLSQTADQDNTQISTKSLSVGPDATCFL